ncbi:MAG TPA: sigma-70 family RNA polymerase sigma factor [Acidimicrobiales bacterium]|nr:sigma-70 family RNA polymerase sigma factor [Acidimicrobiales bacterium]
MAPLAQDIAGSGGDDDDGELVLAVQRGDVDAFAQLYRRHYHSVRRACERRLSDIHEADEVSQAAFVRAFERIHQCGGERRFGPWVHVIARSLCMDTFRAHARVEPREEPLSGGYDHRPNEPEESLLSSERADQVHQALASLPDRQRRAVIARDWEGLRPGEIAERLDLSVGAVDSLLLRARRRLVLSYRRLAGEGGGGAVTVPIRPAMAGFGVAVALGSQSVLAAAAHAVQGTASRAAGGVVSAVVAVAVSLGPGPAPAPEPVPDPPAAATVVAVPPDPVLPLLVRTAPTREAPGAPPRPGPSPLAPEVSRQADRPVAADVADVAPAEPAATAMAVAGAATAAGDPSAPPPTSDRRRSTPPAPPPPALSPAPATPADIVDTEPSPLAASAVVEAPAAVDTEKTVAPPPPAPQRPEAPAPSVEAPSASVAPALQLPVVAPD